MIDETGEAWQGLSEIEKGVARKVLSGEVAVGNALAWIEGWYRPYGKLIKELDRVEGRIGGHPRGEGDEADERRRLAKVAVQGFAPNDDDLPKLSGKFIRQLARGLYGSVPAEGVRLDGFRIEDALDLSDLDLSFGISLEGCRLRAGLNLTDASARWVRLLHCWVDHGFLEYGTYALVANGLDLSGNFVIWESVLVGESQMLRANIGGILLADGSHLQNPNLRALSMQGIRVRATVFLRSGFRAEGTVDLLGAEIGGSLECSNGSFLHLGGTSLQIDEAKIEAGVVLTNHFRSEGTVRFISAEIGGSLECSNGSFLHQGGTSLQFDGAKIDGGVLLREGFRSEGTVRFVAADIGTQLGCENGTFLCPDGDALLFDGATVRESVLLQNGFYAEGQVRLTGATIGGRLSLKGATIKRPGQTALLMRSAKIGGEIQLRKPNDEDQAVSKKYSGKINCDQTIITGHIDAIGGTAIAIDAGGFEIDGDLDLTRSKLGTLDLKSASITGRLILEEAHISGRLDLKDASFFEIEDWPVPQLELSRSKIDGTLVLRPKLVFGSINLSRARVGVLEDGLLFGRDTDSDGLRSLELDGLEYNRIVTDVRGNSPRVIETLNLCNGGIYTPQPYEQMSKVLRNMGLSKDAIDVAIAKRRAARSFKPRWKRSVEWVFLDFFVGYGYKPWKAAIPWVISLAATCVVCWWSRESGWVRAFPKGSDSQGFNWFVYALDIHLPLVDLRQRSSFVLTAGPPDWSLRSFAYGWLTFAEILSWLLVTLLVASLTGLIKRD